LEPVLTSNLYLYIQYLPCDRNNNVANFYQVTMKKLEKMNKNRQGKQNICSKSIYLKKIVKNIYQR